MARDVSREVAAAAVPAVIRLRLARESGALAVIGQHAIGLELQQVTGDQILGVLERAAVQPHRVERERSRPEAVRSSATVGGTPRPGQEGRGNEQRQRAGAESELDGAAARQWQGHSLRMHAGREDGKAGSQVRARPIWSSHCSSVRGQSSRSRRDSARSASRRPPV